MQTIRTDLAMEAKQAGGEIEGVTMEQENTDGITLTRVCVRNERGAQALQKPIGTYITIDYKELDQTAYREPIISCIASQLRQLLENQDAMGTVLIIGLGNRALTPDALGSYVVQNITVTRHMEEFLPAGMRPVCALAPGVMGMTGLETYEIVGAVVRSIQPDCVLIVDSLAARSTQRLLSTVQITDAGIAPGSGVGNHRKALDHKSLGVPVIAIGVPTVVHASTILSEAVQGEGIHMQEQEDLVVTPILIDEAVQNIAILLAKSIDFALHMKTAP